MRCLAVGLALAALPTMGWSMLDNHGTARSGGAMRTGRVSYDDLPGWRQDDHAAALAAFIQACQNPPGPGPQTRRRALIRICDAARQMRAQARDPGKARRFFEKHFVPVAISGRRAGPPKGFLTGYYEPVLEGSLTQTGDYTVPILRRPDDLVQVSSDVLRATANAANQPTAGRRVDGKIVPYYTRAEIEDGILKGRGLEMVWLKDPVAAFFMHVQGSGRIRLPDGQLRRIGFAGKSGHPYTSIGGVLIDRGIATKEAMNLDVLRDWLRANPKEGRALMQQNKSYIFFQFNPQADAWSGPIGAQGSPLTAGRSLAVDAKHHVLGTPIYVEGPTVTHHGEPGFRRLMISQDVGSAIKGPERGDIYWGSGEEAEKLAGLMRHPGRFFMLLPRR
jgi:membrane-bound lytic murein transglycosylase A